MKLFPQVVSLLLSPILAVWPLSAQQAELRDSPAGAPAAEQLQVHLVGDRNASPVGSLDSKGFALEVTDGSGAKVQNAAIAIRLPDSGPSGTFPDGSHAAVVYTDQFGRASLGDVHWGATPGTVPIRITASKGAAHAGILIEQTLTSPMEKPVIALFTIGCERSQTAGAGYSGYSDLESRKSRSLEPASGRTGPDAAKCPAENEPCARVCRDVFQLRRTESDCRERPGRFET